MPTWFYDGQTTELLKLNKILSLGLTFLSTFLILPFVYVF